MALARRSARRTTRMSCAPQRLQAANAEWASLARTLSAGQPVCSAYIKIPKCLNSPKMAPHKLLK